MPPEKPDQNRPYIDLAKLRRSAPQRPDSEPVTEPESSEPAKASAPRHLSVDEGHAKVVYGSPRSGKTNLIQPIGGWYPEQPAEEEEAKPVEKHSRRWPWQRRGAGEAAGGQQPRKRRRWKLRVAGVLVLALLGWIVFEQVTKDSGDSYSPSESAVETVKPDPASVKNAVRSYELILTGKVKNGCALYVDPARCAASRSGAKRTFLEAPHATKSAGVPEQGKHPESTVTIVQFRHTTAPDDTQQWAVLVRNTDHKVIGTEALGADEAGMTLVQVGQQIREED